MGPTHQPDSSSPAGVVQLLRGLVVRVWAFALLRGLIFATIAGLTGYFLAAWFAGPVVSWGWAIASWLGIFLAAGSGFYLATRRLPRTLTSGASLLTDVDPHLPSRLRTALELGEDIDAGRCDPQLVFAHATQTLDLLRLHPAKQVAPAGWNLVPGVSLGLLTAALIGLGFAAFDAPGYGSYALRHPSKIDADGTPIGAVIERVDASITYPAYHHRKKASLANVFRVEVASGSSLQLAVYPFLPVTAGEILYAGRRVPLSLERQKKNRGELLLRATVTASETGPLLLRVRDVRGRWIQDRAVRTIKTVPDKPPSASIQIAKAAQHVDQDEAVLLPWEAKDDIGLDSIILFVQRQGSEPEQDSLEQIGGRARASQGFARISFRDFGAQPGDVFNLWIEATDSRVEPGPGIGRSRKVVFRVATEDSRREEVSAALQTALEFAVDALADRLEAPPIPVTPTEGSRRTIRRCQQSTRAYLESLENLSTLPKSPSFDDTDQSTFAAQRKNLRHLVVQELKEAGGAEWRGLPAVFDQITRTLEDQITALDQRYRQLHEAQLRKLLGDLEQLQQAMKKEISEARRQGRRANLEVPQAMVAEKLSQLRAASEKLRSAAPDEYLNLEALARESRLATPETNAEGATSVEEQNNRLASQLGEMRQALEDGRLLDSLEQLPQPNRDAYQAIQRLTSQQTELQRRTESVAQSRHSDTRPRALSAQDIQPLQETVDGILRSMEGADPSFGGATHGRLFHQAKQRTQDLRDALEVGDLEESQRMARLARASAGHLARDLGISAEMFAGADGATGEAARAASAGFQQLQEVEQRLDTLRAERGNRLSRTQQSRLRRSAEVQERLADEVREVASRLGESAPERVSGALQRVLEAMTQATRELEQGRPREALRRQQDAVQQLRQFDQQSPGQGDLDDIGALLNQLSSAPSGTHNRERISIPEATEFVVPREARRQVVRSMGQDVPEEFRAAVRGYLEGLLQ